MKKYAKVINEENKQCEIGSGTNSAFYQSLGMVEMEVEQAYDGSWYLVGFAPQKPESIKAAEEIAELKNKLNNSDYAIIKIAEGVATKEEYQDIITNRSEWRARINELEAKIDS